MATLTNVTADNLCVLICSDEIFAQQASLDLRSAGYISVVGKDAAREMQHLNILQPAMIVIDKTWQAEPGWKFCRQLRNAGYRIPILMLVDEETVEERVACLQAGADDYIRLAPIIITPDIFNNLVSSENLTGIRHQIF